MYDLARRRVYLAGAGKATVALARVLDELLGPLLTDACVVVREGQGEKLKHVEVREAAHPVPDERSLAAGHRLLGIAGQAVPGDLLVTLVTGGSSALAVVPAPGLTLADKIA